MISFIVGGLISQIYYRKYVCLPHDFCWIKFNLKVQSNLKKFRKFKISILFRKETTQMLTTQVSPQNEINSNLNVFLQAKSLKVPLTAINTIFCTLNLMSIKKMRIFRELNFYCIFIAFLSNFLLFPSHW